MVVMEYSRKPRFTVSQDENDSNYLESKIRNNAGDIFVAKLNREDNSGNIFDNTDTAIANIPSGGGMPDIISAIQNYMVENYNCSFSGYGEMFTDVVLSPAVDPVAIAQAVVEAATFLAIGETLTENFGSDPFVDYTTFVTAIFPIWVSTFPGNQGIQPSGAPYPEVSAFCIVLNVLNPAVVVLDTYLACGVATGELTSEENFGVTFNDA